MNTAGRILNNLLRGYDLEGIGQAGTLRSAWSGIVGETIAAHTLPEGIREGTLTIRVDSAAWSQQLQFYREKIITKLNENSIPVQQLRFRTGRIDTGSKAPSFRPAPLTPLTEDEAAAVKAWCEGIEDGGLRKKFEHLIHLGIRRSRRSD